MAPWCDQHLAPPDGADFFASRVWYDTILAHALPKGAEPWFARCGKDLLVPLLRQEGRLGALVTPYSLEWRPLPAPQVDAARMQAAGRELARILARRAPTRLEAMDADAPGLEALLQGLRTEGFAIGRYHHFGNWHERLAADAGWSGYLAARPSALRATIQRRTATMLRRCQLSLHAAPGTELESAIRAYVVVRDHSWKPPEPFPEFDAALLRATAAIGALRLGVLRDAQGQPIAAQYWVLTGGRAMLLKLAHLREEKAGSPGTVLTALMIRHLIEVDGATELDFGRGDDAYKQLWCGQRRQRIGLILSDPWHPAGLLQVARQAAQRGRDFVLGRMDA